MARLLPILVCPLIVFYLLSSFSTISATAEDQSYARSLDPKLLGLKKQKLSHFHFYWHDIVSGPNPTAVLVVPPPKNSSTAFGTVRMIDDPLTLGTNITSKLIGRAQGFYASASQKDLDLLMVMNFVFTEGKYNGSTITILGRNPLFNPVRELPVISGTGLFRFARGYAEIKTHMFDLNTLDAVVEYNVYVLHY
ncbi:hypothetical protein F2P56_011762 [Juglans regia]|uniref:Dirigent protein n=2 Tax=Juglans regia TaxID=51240 RepID=A0A833XU38_JUGRE|nr:dirigent protein 22-like [Juglans regia]KAF5471319.1 hypothetical protein F2P56_011762 [Juglans regia]